MERQSTRLSGKANRGGMSIRTLLKTRMQFQNRRALSFLKLNQFFWALFGTRDYDTLYRPHTYRNMPTVLRTGPYRFQFYADECHEPVHVHAFRDDNECKIWVSTGEVAANKGFSGTEVRRILKIVESNRELILTRWNANCNG